MLASLVAVLLGALAAGQPPVVGAGAPAGAAAGATGAATVAVLRCPTLNVTGSAPRPPARVRVLGSPASTASSSSSDRPGCAATG